MNEVDVLLEKMDLATLEMRAARASKNNKALRHWNDVYCRALIQLGPHLVMGHGPDGR